MGCEDRRRVSLIPDLHFAVCNSQFAIRSLQFAVCNSQSAIRSLQFAVCNSPSTEWNNRGRLGNADQLVNGEGQHGAVVAAAAIDDRFTLEEGHRSVK
jgi:hypothetical protein